MLERTATKDCLARSNQQVMILETTVEGKATQLTDTMKQLETLEANNEMLEQQPTMTRSRDKSFSQCS